MEPTETDDFVDNIVLSILLYADDIVLFAENEENLQELLFITQNWCSNNRLEINLSKTNIMHVRTKKIPQSQYMFLFNFHPVPYCKNYKYLGCNFDEHLDFNYTAGLQAESAGRALSCLITKMIKNL